VKQSEAAIRAKAALAAAVLHDIDRLHRAVNEIRAARADLARVEKASANAPLAARASGLDGRLAPIEENLMQVNMKGSEANLAYPGMLNERLATFALGVDDADTMPTTQHLAVYQSLHDQLEAQLAAWQTLKAGDLSAFNAAAHLGGGRRAR
jgi:hypothetical protein